MLDIKYIRENSSAIKDSIVRKKIDLDLEVLLQVDEKRRELLNQIESLQATRNTVSKEIPQLTGTEREVKIVEMREVGTRISELETMFASVEEEFLDLMCKVPTVQADDTPPGKSDEENIEVEVWGEKPQFGFAPKTHIEIGKELDIIDFDRGVKVSGFRGYYLKGDGAMLLMALMSFALQKMVAKGYMPMIPPTLVKGSALFGSGYFKGRTYNPDVDEVYKVASHDLLEDGKDSGEDKFLVGTAEPSLLAYYSGETLQAAQLPLKLSGFSPCYRSEIGSYGRDTKGMYRVHEFFKVEQVVIAPADIEVADNLQREMLEISKEMHRELGLPYRVLRICDGDLSAGKYKQYDLEAWMPVRNGYGETGSSSNFLDWQARRLDVKYKDVEGKKQHVYMLNNTALPSPRIIISILENFQQADGSVRIPKVLQGFMGKDKITAPNV